MNLNAHAARVGFRSQVRLGGVSVVYRRGEESAELAVVSGRVNTDLMTSAGIAVDAKEKDFTILAEELILGGQRVEPKRGDQIELDDGDQVETYELMPLSGTDRIFTYGDPNQVTLRVHTKRLKVVTSE